MMNRLKNNTGDNWLTVALTILSSLNNIIVHQRIISGLSFHTQLEPETFIYAGATTAIFFASTHKSVHWHMHNRHTRAERRKK